MKVLLSVVVVAAIFMGGCSRSKIAQSPGVIVPAWYKSLPQEEKAKYQYEQDATGR